MEEILSKSQFKPKALHYFRWVQRSGKEIVITERGKPVIRIAPYAENWEDILSSLRNTVKYYENPTEPVGLEDGDECE